MNSLEQMANKIRLHTVQMTANAKAPHIASVFSCVEILTALYFDVATLFPDDPRSTERDRIILSKGHAAPGLYACLVEKGFFSATELESYSLDGSILAEHPSYGTLPGIECTSGSLGHGLGVGVGVAKGIKLNNRNEQVYVILSDGECNEGAIWEAALWAPKHQLNNLTAIIDFNKYQACGKSTEITSLAPLDKKWEAFGWDVIEVDGHDFPEIINALKKPRTEKPRAIVAHTIKGKGISFMENDLEWHYRPPQGEELANALKELEEKK